MDVGSVQELSTLQFRERAAVSSIRQNADAERLVAEQVGQLQARQADSTMASLAIDAVTSDRGNKVNIVV